MQLTSNSPHISKLEQLRRSIAGKTIQKIKGESKARMLFQVAQAEESDLRDIAMRLDQAAMSDNGINQTLDKVLAQQNKSRADFFLEYISGGFKNDRETFWKVVDSDTGDLVAAAWYGFHVAGDRQSKQSSPSPPSKDVGVAPAVQQSSEDAYLMEVMTKLFRDWHDFKKEHIRDQPHASERSSFPVPFSNRAYLVGVCLCKTDEMNKVCTI